MDFLRPRSRWPVLRRASIGVFLLAATACRQQQAEYFGTVEPPPGNVFRFNNGAEPEFLDPSLMTGQPDGRIARLLFEGLTDIDQETLQARPGMAERWDLSADQRTYTFYLRRNAVWSDGRPITASDFVYSWRRVLDPATASRYASHLYHIVNGQEFNEGRITDPSQVAVRALGDYTLEVRLKEPVPYFLYLTSFYTYFPNRTAAAGLRSSTSSATGRLFLPSTAGATASSWSRIRNTGTRRGCGSNASSPTPSKTPKPRQTCTRRG
jgi:ABC-type oligopeptide transport system substrate-binding subunit